MPSEAGALVIVRLDERRYALPLAVVDRVFHAVEITPLPQAPADVLGVIDVHGHVLPVLNLRRRFLLPERPVRPSDWFLLVHTSRRTVVLVVDSSDGVVARPAADITPSAGLVQGVEQFPGVVRLDDGLVLIHDPAMFLSLDEQRALDRALDDAGPR